MSEIPLALYIHLPWCVRKCPYCDFNSHKLTHNIDQRAYVEHLIKDFTADYQQTDKRPIASIFFGGGTPSLFEPKHINTLLNHVQAHALIAPDCEITLEANPGTAEQQKFADFLHAGVNRLSIGVQSFYDRQLQLLGRIHDSNEAKRAITIAQQVGFQRLNVDIMFALPEQTLKQAIHDLEQAIAFAPEHLSWYQLTLEPNTAFYDQPPPLPTEDQQIEIYEAGGELLRAHGYRQYEISAWTQQAPSQHNLNYWQFGDYIGIGAGAHGKLTLDNGEIIRTSKFRAPGAYQRALGQGQNPYTDQRQQVSLAEQPFEFMLNALRLQDGVPTNLLTQRTQLSIDELEPTLEQLVAQGLIKANYHTHLQTTPRGFAMLNDVLNAFLAS